jgi:hypothetical protein
LTVVQWSSAAWFMSDSWMRCLDRVATVYDTALCS